MKMKLTEGLKFAWALRNFTSQMASVWKLKHDQGYSGWDDPNRAAFMYSELQKKIYQGRFIHAGLYCLFLHWLIEHDGFQLELPENHNAAGQVASGTHATLCQTGECPTSLSAEGSRGEEPTRGY